MSEQSERLLKVILDSKLTYVELEKKTGIAKSSIQRYASGHTKKIPVDAVKLIADATNSSAAWIMGWADNEINNNVSKISAIEMEACGIMPYNPIVHKIPILGYISAGLPLYAEEHIQGYTYTERNGGAEYFALKVKGDSMSAAQINDNNIVIVRKQENVENGEIAVVRVGKDDATVKRFKRDGDIVQLIPQSFNPSHEIQIYDLKNTDIQIIGKVVECKIEF